MKKVFNPYIKRTHKQDNKRRDGLTVTHKINLFLSNLRKEKHEKTKQEQSQSMHFVYLRQEQ